MRKEREMFAEALNFLERHYEQTDFNQLALELPQQCRRYKGSGLWQNLILAVVDHLEAKAKYEQRIKASEQEEDKRIEKIRG